MAFMEVPAAKRKGLLRRSAVASVEALEYLHRVRRSGKARVRNRVMVEVSGRRPKRKRADGDAAECLDRWRRLAMDPMRASFLGRHAGRVLAGRTGTESTEEMRESCRRGRGRNGKRLSGSGQILR